MIVLGVQRTKRKKKCTHLDDTKLKYGADSEEYKRQMMMSLTEEEKEEIKVY